MNKVFSKSTKQFIKQIINRILLKKDQSWRPIPADFYDTSVTNAHDFSKVNLPEGLPLEQPLDYIGTPVEFSSFPPKGKHLFGVYQFNNANVFFNSGLIKVEGGGFIKETTWFKNHIHQIKFPFKPENRNQVNLDGTSLLLSTDYADNNYGHFLLDGICRLAIFLKFNPTIIANADWIIINGPPKSWKIKLLSRLDIPESKLIWSENKTSLKCEKLTACSFPGFRRFYFNWLVDFARNTFKYNKFASSAPKRLFISRKNTSRNIVNEDKILLIAQSFGFERYFPEHSDDPIADFANADGVIGAHGSGLTDILFMQPGKKVLELLPTDHRHPYFYTLALAANLDYSILLCKSLNERPRDTLGPSPYDFRVDEENFGKYLKENYSLSK